MSSSTCRRECGGGGGGGDTCVRLAHGATPTTTAPARTHHWQPRTCVVNELLRCVGALLQCRGLVEAHVLIQHPLVPGVCWQPLGEAHHGTREGGVRHAASQLRALHHDTAVSRHHAPHTHAPDTLPPTRHTPSKMYTLRKSTRSLYAVHSRCISPAFLRHGLGTASTRRHGIGTARHNGTRCNNGAHRTSRHGSGSQLHALSREGAKVQHQGAAGVRKRS